MEDHRQDSRYEALYTQLLERGMDMHVNNKKRIRIGLAFLGVFLVNKGWALWENRKNKA